MRTYRRLISAAVFAAATLAMADAQAFDDSKFPDLRGQWRRMEPGGPAGFDGSKPGWKQEAPLTPEYQAIFEANLADQAAGGQGTDPTYTCLAPGMPRIMIAYGLMELVVTPATTYILIEHIHDNRRIFTDGRTWPEEMEPQFAGYSIGQWLDEDGDGVFDTLVVETRGMKGPRTFDETGIPLHKDNKTVIKERIFIDKTNPNVLHDEITTIDNALTRPWVVTRNYRRSEDKGPVWWMEQVCGESNGHIEIGKQNYFLSADGLLMPARKDQPPPDLRYFKKPPQN
jgi:hypothetical protein